MNNNKQPTQEVLKLQDLLNTYGIESITEYWDGHKHVVLYIPKGNLYIEVDGPTHYTNTNQMFADILRDHYSDLDGIPTIRIPNNAICEHLERVAKAIAGVVETQK